MYLTIMLPWLCHVILVGQNLPPILATRTLFSKMADEPIPPIYKRGKKRKDPTWKNVEWGEEKERI